MFLEQRSPFRVRVRSIKTELFFLKKFDAVKISTNYQNIWKRINKKSVFNFEQIKKSVKNIVEIYCTVKKINSNNKQKLSYKIDPKENDINIRRNKSDSSISILKTIKEEEYPKKSQSQKNNKINYNKIYDEFILDKNKDININSTAVNLKRKKNFILPNSNIKSSLISSNSSSSSKITAKKNNNKKTKHKNNNTKIEIMNNNESKKEEKKVPKNSIDSGFSSIIRKSKIPPIENKVYSSIHFNNDLLNKNKKQNSKKEKHSESEDSYNKQINDEIKSNEEINIIKEENLLNKKIDLNFVAIKQLNCNNIYNNLKLKNSKLQKILNLLDNKNSNDNSINENSDKNNNSLIKKEYENEDNIATKHLDINNNIINNNNDSSEIASPINNINKNIINLIRKKNSKFSINSAISFKINSSYENFNLISGNILIKNKKLQNKIKTNLLNEIKKISKIEINFFNRNKNISSEDKTMRNSLGDSLFFGDKSNKFMILSNMDKRQSSPLEYRKNQSLKKRDSNSCHYSKSTDKKQKLLNNSSSLNENVTLKNKIDKNSKINKLQSGTRLELENSFINNKPSKKRRLSQHEILINNLKKMNTFGNINMNNSALESKKKYKPKKNSSIKKKKDNSNNLFSQINLNIQKTNQNLNNPEEFYSSYFNSILGDRNNEKTPKRNSIFFIGDINTPKTIKRKSNQE